MKARNLKDWSATAPHPRKENLASTPKLSAEEYLSHPPARHHIRHRPRALAKLISPGNGGCRDAEGKVSRIILSAGGRGRRGAGIFAG